MRINPDDLRTSTETFEDTKAKFANDDARWRNVPDNINHIDRAEVLRLDLAARDHSGEAE